MQIPGRSYTFCPDWLEVVAFFEEKHKNHFMVYNMCAESHYQYDSSLFDGNVKVFPFMDHNPCPVRNTRARCTVNLLSVDVRIASTVQRSA